MGKRIWFILLGFLLEISISTWAQSGPDSTKANKFKRHCVYAEIPLVKAFQMLKKNDVFAAGLMQGYALGYGYQLKRGGEIFAGLNTCIIPDIYGYIPGLVEYSFGNNPNLYFEEFYPDKRGPDFLVTLEKRFYLFRKYKLQPFFALGLCQYLSYSNEAYGYSTGDRIKEKINAWTGLGGWHFRAGLRFQYNRYGVSIWGGAFHFYEKMSWTSTSKFKYIRPNLFNAMTPEFSISYSF